MIEKILYGIILFVFPIVFLYPQGLLYGTYLNYAYVLLCAALLYLMNTKYSAGFSFEFYKRLFVLNLFANSISLLLFKTNVMQFISGNAPILCAVCLNFIVTAIPKEKEGVMKKIILTTTIVVLLLIVLDGLWKPSWMYQLYYFTGTTELELLFTFHHRAMGSLLSPVMAGFFCATIIVYCFVHLVYQKWSLLYTALLILSSLGLLLTASRTSMLALAFMLLFFLTLYKAKNRTVVICICLIATLTVTISDLPLFNDIVKNLTYRNEQLSSGVFEGTGRSATIISALQNKFDGRCLLWGIGSAEYSIIDNSFSSMAHNGLLSIFLPFGVAGIYLHYKLYKHYLIFRDNEYCNDKYSLFTSLWIVTLIGTFLSADMTISYFSVCIQAVLLALADRNSIVNSEE